MVKIKNKGKNLTSREHLRKLFEEQQKNSRLKRSAKIK